jgi:hypothetical protein
VKRLLLPGNSCCMVAGNPLADKMPALAALKITPANLHEAMYTIPTFLLQVGWPAEGQAKGRQRLRVGVVTAGHAAGCPVTPPCSDTHVSEPLATTTSPPPPPTHTQPPQVGRCLKGLTSLTWHDGLPDAFEGRVKCPTCTAWTNTYDLAALLVTAATCLPHLRWDPQGARGCGGSWAPPQRASSVLAVASGWVMRCMVVMHVGIHLSAGALDTPSWCCSLTPTHPPTLTLTLAPPLPPPAAPNWCVVSGTWTL